MSQRIQNQYSASCRARYPSRNRQGKSAMIGEVSDNLSWDRKHTINALNGKVSHGKCAQKRGSKPIYTTEEIQVIIGIWKRNDLTLAGVILQWRDTRLIPHEIAD
jgi:hypothetical protein